MKVVFKYAVGAYSGTVDQMVYSMASSRLGSIARKWVMPTPNANNAMFGTIGSNLRNLWLSASQDYRDDFGTYAKRYHSEHLSDGIFDPCRSPYAFFLKAMWNWHAANPETIDLASVNEEDVDTLGTTINTVKNCVENGMVPTISVYDDLTGVF